MSILRYIAAATVLVVGVATSARAEPVAIKWPIENTRSGTYTNYYKPWSDKINSEGKDVLAIEIVPGTALANISNMYDRVTNDVVQMGFTLFANVAGKFVLSDVAALPFLSEDAERASVALYRLYKSGALDSEFTDVRPLLLVGLPQSMPHFTKQPRALDDWSGLKMITPTKIVSLVTRQMGGVPLTIQINEIYGALQRGVADGTILSWNPFTSFKLDEVTTFHVETSLGTAAGFVIMAKKFYAALPAAAKKVIDDNSDEAATRAYAKVWDADNDRVRKLAQAMPNHTIVRLEGARREAWARKVQGATDEWVKEAPGRDKILAEYKRLLPGAK
jgi:TRAP-type C4-dicarboxylate transport system substrate-binding protein